MQLKHKLYLICLSILCVFSSCKKDHTSFIGGDLQPDNEFIFAMYNDEHESLNLIAYTIEDFPGITSGRSLYALGSYKDATFGTMKVDLISQIYEAQTWDSVPAEFADGMDVDLIDSVILYLVYSSAYPFDANIPLDPMTISIGELVKPTLINDSTPFQTYRSNDDRGGAHVGYDPGSVLSHYTLMPNLRDSIVDWDSDSTGETKIRVPTLQIPLNNPEGMAYAKKLLETSAKRMEKSILPEVEGDLPPPSFLRDITGLYIETHPEVMTGRGNILSFDFSGSSGIYPAIWVYYKKPSKTENDEDTLVSATKQYDLGFWDAMTYNYIEVVPSTRAPILADQLNKNDTTLGQDMVFLQSFFSTMINIEMPDIRNFVNLIDTNTQVMIINQASLVMPTSPNGPNGRFTPTASLNLGHMKNAGTDSVSMTDLRDHAVTIGGGYNSSKGEYRIILTRHIQRLLLDPYDEKVPDLPLTIYSNTRHSIPDITSFFGPNHADRNRRMRLEIVYSVLPK
jgi:hypothetical protein